MSEPMQEPSVLDYLRSRLPFGKQEPIEIPERIQESEPGGTAAPGLVQKPVRLSYAMPWRVLAGLTLAFAAQLSLEPPVSETGRFVALFLYLAAGFFIIWAVWRKELTPLPLTEDSFNAVPLTAKSGKLWIAVAILLPLSFLLFGGNRFTGLNVILSLILIALLVYAFWLPGRKNAAGGQRLSLWQRVSLLRLEIKLSPWSVLVGVVFLAAVFFRFYRLAEVPGEMFSDHAEKLNDVMDVLSGQTSIFFTRNTGREAFQFYLTAAVIQLFGTGISFLSLKIGTALMGVFTLPFIYLLGKEVGNRRVGLFALALAGFAYWPNVIARVALRFALYPAFTAPALYFLIRGLRRGTRNDFIWSGIFLGIGLHGYSPMRIVPFLVVLALILYLLHARSAGQRSRVLAAFILVAGFSLVVFLPLLRYILDDPTMFGARAFSRLGETEQTFIAPVWQIFLDNLWKAWLMPFRDNGSIWVHSIPNRPALDVITAAVYFIGTLLVLARYVKQRGWLDLFLLIAVPFLMLPSILSLAFPDENPSLNRTGAAYIPIFIIAAIGLEAVFRVFYQKAVSRRGQISAVLGVGLLIVLSAAANYRLVFTRFQDQYMAGAWNTSQIGQVIEFFANSIGNRDSAFVVPYPHWVDTRLVGINAGFPEKDYALWAENFDQSLDVSGSKLFILNPQDQESLAALRSLYPTGQLSMIRGPYEGKDFLVFLIPAAVSALTP